MSKKTPSLKASFQKLSLRWSAGAFILTLVLSVSCFFYISAHLEETRISALAQAVTRAFRPMILEKNIRDAQFQMKRVLDLKNGEYAVVRDAHFKTIYSPDEGEVQDTCKKIESVCASGSDSITYLQPVYFDDDRKENLFGYVELKIKSQTDLKLIGFFILLLTSIFLAVMIGVSSTQSEIIKLIRDTMQAWAKHLKESPTEQAPSSKVPFAEFEPLEASISELHLEIERLKESAAAEARFKTQLSMLREIGHDLKTPFSQLAKFFSVYQARVERTGQSDAVLVGSITRSMNRVGNLIRQVESLAPQRKATERSTQFTNIAEETKLFIDDFLKARDVNEANTIFLDISNDCKNLAAIPKAQFYRILDNLLRNALDATQGKIARIEIAVGDDGERPTLWVQDNGCGIKTENLNKIFDAEFTTKPARGTGLGLSIVKKICANFQANITAKSKLDLGSEFKISFMPYSEVKLAIDPVNTREAML